MRIFDAVYGTVRRSILNATAGRKPAEWEAAITEAFQQLQAQDAVSSWSAVPYLQGLIIQVVIPGHPSADLLVLPRSGTARI